MVLLFPTMFIESILINTRTKPNKKYIFIAQKRIDAINSNTDGSKLHRCKNFKLR